MMAAAFHKKQQRQSVLPYNVASVDDTSDGCHISIDVVNGDLTQENTDAIVNIINTEMNMNRGRLNKALSNACGPQVQQECNQLGSQPPGSAVITSGGHLNVPHIIHIVPGSSDKWHLQECLEGGLYLADHYRLQSISIPAIGTGNFKLSATDSAQLIFEALGNVCASFCSLSEVRIVVYQENMVEAFQQEQQKHLMLPCKLAPVHSAADGSRISIDVVNGDLTQENTDAIVNIINTDMNMNRGRLNKALANACGPQVQQECNQLGSQPPGSAVITSGGNLNVPHIVHIVPGSSDKKHLQECLEEGLRLADKCRVQSISIPAIGTGNFRLSATKSAKLVFKALRNVIGSFVNISKVRIVVFDGSLIQAFQDEMTRLDTQYVPHGSSSRAPAIDKSCQPTVRAWEQLISKMVEWSYESNGRKTAFDLRANAKLEMAHSKKHSTEQVTVREKEFIVNMETLNGRCYRDGERIKIYREPNEGIPLPENWAPIPLGTKVLPIALASGSQEYQDVMGKFNSTLGGVNILTIERIQNPVLYQSYMVRKKQMDKDTGGNSERQLFHGTDSKNINHINTQGFNRSLCGTHGTLLGNGVYFARAASYSARYTGSGRGGRCMYLARVLVGRYCQGRPSLLTPPSRDPIRPEVLYDSVVDNPTNPTIFVVFYDNQCYPEYLISFKK